MDRETVTDVVVVGGGPVGLAASLELSRQGVRHVLLERHAGTSVFPKARLITTRSMELLRSWGLQEEVERTGLPRGESLALCIAETLTSPRFRREEARVQADAPQSPTYGVICSQDLLEVVLRRAAEASPLADVRFGTRAGEVRDVDGGVELDLDGGGCVRARYAVAADGSRSPVRTARGIGVDGPPPLSHMVSVMVSAPIGPLVADRPSALYFVRNAEVQCAVEAVDGTDRWMLQLAYRPDRGEGPGDFTDAVCTAAVRAAVGVADLPVRVLGVMPWTQQAVVARTFRSGRVLLAGDAAHVATPQGGFGMNCGIADVGNLGWKLAAVLRGDAPDGLLDTYHDERHPVATWTARESLRNAEITRDMMTGALSPAEAGDLQALRRRAEGMVLGCAYASAAVLDDGTPAPAPDYEHYRPTARPGHRAPHAWLPDGSSVLDSFGPGFTLVVPAGSPAAAPPGTGRVELPPAAAAAYGIPAGGGLLVRPDGHVAWRSSDAYGASVALAAVLGRSEVATAAA